MVSRGPPPIARLSYEFEPSELALEKSKRTLPPVIGGLVFLAVFFGFVFGTVLNYEGDELLGTVLYMIAMVVPALFIVSWIAKARR